MILASLALRFDVVSIGLMAGLGYAVLGAGLVLVFRSSRIINLAHGQIGAFSAVLLLVLVDRYKVPYALALPLAIGTGALIGVVVERGLVRPLARRSALAVLVATIGVTQVLIVAMAWLPKVIGARFPEPINVTVRVGDLVLHGEHFTLLVLGPLSLALLACFLGRTRWGLAIRAVADNHDAALLSGIDAGGVSQLVWAVAGALAAMAAILTFPLSGAGVGTGAGLALGPSLLLRALAAGLAGRLVSLPKTVVAGVVIGVGEAILYASYPEELGVVDALLLVGILVLLLLQSRTGGGDDASLTFGSDPHPLSARIRALAPVRRAKTGGAIAAVVVAVALPVVFSSSSELFLLARVPIFAIIGISMVVLTGWAGQLSLAQMSFVGLGALGTAALGSRGVPFGAAVGYMTFAGLLVAMVVGAPALRLRGLLLCVITLGLAVASTSYFLQLGLFRSSSVDTAVVLPGKLGPIDFNSYRVDYYLCLAALVVTVLLARRLRASGIGRSIIAVEGNEQSAAAMTISPAATKILSFALAGSLATFAGGLLAGVSRTFQVDAFSPDQSLQVLAMAVVGGIGSIAGGVLGAIYLVAVPNLFGDSTTARLATSGIGLLILLRFEPGGLIALAERARDALLRRFVDDIDVVDEAAAEQRGAVLSAAGAERERGVVLDRDEALDEPPADPLSVVGVSVNLGGRAIVSDVDLHVGPDEIVGLIGSNGAGKTTLMNAISGFVPSTGRVLLAGNDLAGNDLAGYAPHLRARLGLGRSFQTALLYPRLTTRECIQVALEARERCELLPAMLALPPGVRTERRNRLAAEELIDLMGLGLVADKLAGNLSTGTRRIVELACLLAARPSVILLDEPMAGIAQRESEAFAPLILDLRRHLDTAMLIIEHDLPLISTISDRLYCLETGRVIAEGTPDEVRADPRVVASYLGTDERAIARSDRPQALATLAPGR
jgi:ABC-type branched-subunit amino acid transport system ATPase component/branched-subunit amino acid ABC-type transport system permease component